MSLFNEIALIVVLATLVSLLMKFLRQPLIVGYLLTGILVGPYVLNILEAHNELELFSKIGIALLLFIVGLTLNPDILHEVGWNSLMTGMGQVFFTSVIGYFITRLLGYDALPAIYIAVALTFSSTIIILKLLSDRGDLGKLYGKIAIGFLIVQDVVAAILLLVVTMFSVGESATERYVSNTAFGGAVVLLGMGVLISILLYLISKYLLPSLVRLVAGSQEVLFIFALAWGLGMSALFHVIGFSIEIGALVAGVTLAVSPFAYEIASRLKPLRDFFIMLFFVLLGSQLIFTELSTLLGAALILSLFVLIGNPLIVIVLMGLLGYRQRTAFMAGLTVAQISEFSLILIALAFSLGHIGIGVVSLVTLVGVVTIVGSTYLIQHADGLYLFLKPVISLVTFNKSKRNETHTNDIFEVIILGYDRVGYDFVESAKKITERYMVIDFNPASIVRAKNKGIPYRFGDAEDIEFLDEVNITKARLVVSTIPDFRTNLAVLTHYRKSNTEGIFITISHNMAHTHKLYRAGASYVVMSHYLAASHASSLMESLKFSEAGFAHEKLRHLQSLTERAELEY